MEFDPGGSMLGSCPPSRATTQVAALRDVPGKLQLRTIESLSSDGSGDIAVGVLLPSLEKMSDASLTVVAMDEDLLDFVLSSAMDGK